jgi:hypothetical protein
LLLIEQLEPKLIQEMVLKYLGSTKYAANNSYMHKIFLTDGVSYIVVKEWGSYTKFKVAKFGDVLKLNNFLCSKAKIDKKYTRLNKCDFELVANNMSTVSLANNIDIIDQEPARKRFKVFDFLNENQPQNYTRELKLTIQLQYDEYINKISSIPDTASNDANKLNIDELYKIIHGDENYIFAKLSMKIIF